MKPELGSTSLDADQVYTPKQLFRDPLLIVIIGKVIVLIVLTLSVYLVWGTGGDLGDTTRYIPISFFFAGLAAIIVAFLAFKVYSVLREGTPYWIGVGFAATGILSFFLVLTWPGLLPGMVRPLDYPQDTSSWIILLEFSYLSIVLLAAVLSRWPGWSRGKKPHTGRHWIWSAASWNGLVLLICILIVVYERYLSILIQPQGSLTLLVESSHWVFLILFSTGAFLSAMRYRKTGNSLLGYVALTQIALAFVVLAGIIGMKQYGIWYYLGRILMIEGFVSLMIGLLSEYERLYRREREGRQTLEAIMENIPVGLAVAGGPPDFPITMVSRHGLEMIQDPAGKLIGTPNGKRQAAWKLFFPDEKTQAQPEQMPLYKAGQYGEETRNRELVMEVQEGRKIPVLINAAPIRNTQGEVVGAINTWMDITERKQTEEALRKRARELERANRDLRNITMVASHDLQEPLRKIEALGDSILVMTSDLDERLYDRIQRMRNSARQMRNMITGLNELSFLTTDIQPFQSVDLNEITTEVLGKLDRKIQESGASVEVGELPTIDADPKQMRILLHHLIDNALKFQPKGGKPLVRVSSLKTEPSTIQILVEDNGIGFDENHAKYLFKPFARLDGKNQSEYEGIGIGLAVCRWITEHHGGDITAHSAPGRGATFTVTIPVFQQNDTEITT